MRFCLYIPVGNVTPGEFQTPEAVGEMVEALERAGVDACCVTDHPAPSSEWLHASGHDALDPFAALAFIAAHSSRLLLQTSVLVLPYRNPFLTAKAATTLQVLSRGRLILGVGAGYQEAEFEALGVDFRRRGRLTDEALETIREIWQGGKIVKQGDGFTARGNEPRPAPSPAPRLWIGGSSDKALRRAARFGDGWCPFFSLATHSRLNRESGIQSVSDLQGKIAFIHREREECGRDGPFDINIAIPSTDDLANRTHQEAERFIERVRELESVGVEWVTLKLPHPDRAEYLENVRWFGQSILNRIDS